VIEIDEDSHSKFVGESGGLRGRHPGSTSGCPVAEEPEDIEWRLDQYCQPRNSLLSLISDFVVKCSAKLAEINKKDRQEKSIELLDSKCYMKLVDIAHSLLKMAPYDQECIKSKGLQKYMNQVGFCILSELPSLFGILFHFQVFPLTDWSLETMRPSLTTIIRRLDKLFSKMHKSVKLYQSVEWKAAAGLLNAVYITLWKHPYIVNVPSLKSLIGTCQCLVVGEESLTSLTDHHGPTGRRPELPPQSFCLIVFKLIALQVNDSGDPELSTPSQPHLILVSPKGLVIKKSLQQQLLSPPCSKLAHDALLLKLIHKISSGDGEMESPRRCSNLWFAERHRKISTKYSI